MTENGALPYRIEPGDELKLNLRHGSLLLEKPNFGFVNLNEFVFGVTKASHRDVLKRFDASSFAVMCDFLAGGHGLRCCDVRPQDGGNVYVCRIESLTYEGQ